MSAAEADHAFERVRIAESKLRQKIRQRDLRQATAEEVEEWAAALIYRLVALGEAERRVEK